jgi:hypothetical protein
MGAETGWTENAAAGNCFPAAALICAILRGAAAGRQGSRDPRYQPT